MKILFDECVPRKFRKLFPGYPITTVPEAGWTGIKNGELLRKAAVHFEVMITVDRNLAFQQPRSSLPLPIILIHGKSNKFKDLEPFVLKIQKLLDTKLSADIYRVGET